MDGRQFDELAKGLATWRTRRQVLTGTVGGAMAGLMVRLGVRAQGGGDAVATYADEAEITESTDTVSEPTPTNTPTPTPTDTPTPTPTDTPTPTPTDTPEAGAAGSPEDEAPAAEETTTEQPSGQVEQVDDEQRKQIAEVCQRAAEALKGEFEFADEYLNHPHADQALAFVAQLQTLAQWGAAEATTWDDPMLSNYLAAVNTAALGVRMGADTYYELAVTGGWRQSGRPEEDPPTCIFEQIRLWEECLQDRGKDSAGQMTCFWEFMVLESCTRCLRAF